MNTQAGERASAPRPRRETKMLDRALEYARLAKGGMTPSDISKKFNESHVTVYKLIRLGNAPKSVISLIRRKEVPATDAANLIHANMTKDQIVEVIDKEIKRRYEAKDKLREAGFTGASSMTMRRALAIAVENIRKRRLLKNNDTRKAVVRTISHLIKHEGKLSPSDIEKAILIN